MNTTDFLERLTLAAYDTGAKAILSELISPSGRRPPTSIASLSRWYQKLPSQDQKMVEALVQISVRAGVFQVLAVIDGAVSIRHGGEQPGQLELWYSDLTGRVLLNDSTTDALHDLFAERVPL
ncbi:MAG: hypothetical protein U0570_08570 [Phycisphaerales bacterium]